MVMKSEMYNKAELLEVIDNDGLDGIRYSINPEWIIDKRIRVKWLDAQTALEELFEELEAE